jgi:hypothetical protein
MQRFLILAAAVGFAVPAPAADPVSATKTADTVEFKIGDKVFTQYHVGKDVAKPYFYPVTAPNGAVVTRGWPMVKGLPDETADHVHQKSVWFCHGDVIPEGLTLKTKSSDKHVQGVDFWSETPGHGRIVCVAVGEPKQVSAHHVLVPTRNEWKAPDGTKVLDETRAVHVIALPTGRLIVLDIDLHASVCPLTFGDTKEGAMGIRVNDSIRATQGKKPGAGTMVNAAGQKGEKEAWGQEAAWVDYFGPIGGKTAGIAVFDGPENTYKSAWHARGYGLLAANPFGRGKSGFPARKGREDRVKLAKGEHLKLRYGIYAHDGDTAAGHVAEAYKAFGSH